MSKPSYIEFSEFVSSLPANAAVWTLDFLADRVTKKFPFPLYVYPLEPDTQHEYVLAIGGGELLDYAKIWRAQKNPTVKLGAIPSIWGSGAENSPVAILNTDNDKTIYMGEEFLPDERSIWRELAAGIPDDLIRYACGDVWSHALEGFLSPIATDETRVDLAMILRELCEIEVGRNPDWFALSASACAGQARSSVGLIHGIAHTLEPILKKLDSSEVYGHARLCATFCLPVLLLNLHSSEKAMELFDEYNLNKESILEKLNAVYSPSDFAYLFPFTQEHWRTILRNPNSRTNCVLVRAGDVDKLRDLRKS